MVTDVQEWAVGYWSFLRGLLKFLAAGMLGFGVAVVLALLNSDDAIPEMFKDLPTLSSDIEPEVDRRIKAAFPPGTPEVRLIAALSGIGFQFAEQEGSLGAHLLLNSFVCSQSFSVTWQSDSDDQIVTVQGGHHLSCL